jgi:hypothetical protein
VKSPPVRLVGGFQVRQVVERGADGGECSRVQQLRVGTQFGMAGHIIHLAVAAFRQPFAQAVRRRPGSARATPMAAKPSSLPASRIFSLSAA